MQIQHATLHYKSSSIPRNAAEGLIRRISAAIWAFKNPVQTGMLSDQAPAVLLSRMTATLSEDGYELAVRRLDMKRFFESRDITEGDVNFSASNHTRLNLSPFFAAEKAREEVTRS